MRLAARPLDRGADFTNTLSLTTLSTVLGLFVTNPGTPAGLTPLADKIVEITGLPLYTAMQRG